MSWLYSIVFAGLLFSSGNDTSVNTNQNVIEQVPQAVITRLDETEKFDQTYPLNANGRVSVSNVNGSIEVVAWDRNEVRLEATKLADSKETLADVNLQIDSTPEYFSVETEYKNWKWNDKGSEHVRNRKLEVQIRISVPRTAMLNEIETVNGSVTLGNFVNFTKVSAVNGNVIATNLRGAANLSTVNGEVTADFDRLETGSKISLSTVNGRVNLVIPSDANATLKADSLNGEIKNDFGLPVHKGQYIGRDLYGRIGTGEVHIKLNSVNGGLTIGRKNDGKSPNPATNMLPQKGKDDNDWDDDTDEDTASAVSVAKANRDVARAVHESQRKSAASVRAAQREAAVSVREAQRAIARVQPELMNLKVEELAELKNINVNIDTKKMQAEIDRAMANQNLNLSMVNWAGGVPMIEKKRNTFPVKGTPKVTIDAKGCNVKIRGWDKPEVQYILTQSSNRRNTTAIGVGEAHSDSAVTLTVQIPNTAGRSDSFFDRSAPARIEVFVPRKTNLKVTTDGEIRLDGVSGEIDLEGGNESINIRDVDGKLHLAAAEAQVRLIGFKGEFDSQTDCGDVYLEGDFAKLTAKATEGTITLTLPENANANFISNTEVETDGLNIVQEDDTKWRLGRGGADYKFDFTDGKLVVRNASVVNAY
jgi:DUF4097 and DUF4098 domain-containing protein YvlB